MDKTLIILSIVELLAAPVLSQTGSNGRSMVVHKEEQVSVPSHLPKLSFEIRLLKNEMMSIRADVDGLQSKLDSIMMVLETLQSKEDDTESTNLAEKQEMKETSDNVIKELEKEVFFLRYGAKSEKQSLRRHLNDIQDKMDIMKTDILDTIDLKFTSNGEKNDILAKHVSDIDKRVTETKQSFENLSIIHEKENDKVKVELQKMTGNIDNLDSSYTQLVSRAAKQKVAFSAGTKATTQELPPRSTIVFDSVRYQTGGGYNPRDGIFTVPESGVYLFSIVLTLTAAENKILNAALIVDDNWKAGIKAENYHSLQEIQASNLVILSLVKGQSVWIKTNEGSNNKIYNVQIYSYDSTFSGALLYLQ